MNSNPPPRFPWWIPVGAVLIAAAYLPTLAAPFDFIDDGNLVYPAPAGTSFTGHVELWWQRVVANYEDLGPFRPTLWAHWQLLSNTFGADPVAWRAWRLAWCALAAGMLLWLFRELGIHPVAALVAGAAAMWNPYRNEIWTSLTLGEGVAMPYALFALVAARRGATARRPLAWDLASIAAVIMALGCKNTFAALIPAQVLLRMWPAGMSLRAAWAANGWRALCLAVTILLPAAHYVYFKLHWHAGQYETHAPSMTQFVRTLHSLKGAMSADFLAVGFGLLFIALWAGARAAGGSVWEGASKAWESHRVALVCAGLLAGAGVFVYLPMSAMSGRYAMPAVWGLDILFALALTALIRLPGTISRPVAWVGVAVGLAVVLVACEARQEKVAARSRILWDALQHIESTIPPGATVGWVCGEPQRGELGIEEGIHFCWHLQNRGRSDLRVALVTADGSRNNRPEISPASGEPEYRIAVSKPVEPGWEPVRVFEADYALARKRFLCVLYKKSEIP